MGIEYGGTGMGVVMTRVTLVDRCADRNAVAKRAIFHHSLNFTALYIYEAIRCGVRRVLHHSCYLRHPKIWHQTYDLNGRRSECAS